MTYLMKQIQDISATKNEMIQNYKNTFYQNQDIKKNIDSKSQELIDITKRVDDLEDIVNLSKNTDDPILYNTQNLQATPEQKKLLLQIVPNGAPINTTAKIASVKLRPHPSKGVYGVAGLIILSHSELLFMPRQMGLLIYQEREKEDMENLSSSPTPMGLALCMPISLRFW